jgi:hypothetical protein
VRILALSVGSGGSAGTAAEGIRGAGAAAVEAWAAAPTAVGIDEALDQLDGRRLVIEADQPGLQLVLTRLLRRGILADQETAVLPLQRVDYLRRVGLPDRLEERYRIAVRGIPRLVGVIKDDSGGVCVDHATVTPWARDSSTWWVRAVVDDQRLCDGAAKAIGVRRLGPAELEATVRISRWRKRTVHGRSLQLACDEAAIIQDGVARERPRSKRTFWSEPLLWNLVL